MLGNFRCNEVYKSLENKFHIEIQTNPSNSHWESFVSGLPAITLVLSVVVRGSEFKINFCEGCHSHCVKEKCRQAISKADSKSPM